MIKNISNLLLWGGALAGGGGGGGDTPSGGEEWIGDGNTHIWISLGEERKSPVLGVCPNGTVTVDWGDGTEPDVLTGTSTGITKRTPTHEYAKAGDYVITLTVDGACGVAGDGGGSYLLRLTSGNDNRNKAYLNAIKKIELGNGTTIGGYAFYSCSSLSSISISNSVKSLEGSAFGLCYSLSSITIPDSVTSIAKSAFHSCSSLSSITIPDSVTSLGNSAFHSCHSLSSVTLPDSVTSMDSNAFYNCSSLSSINIPNSVTSIGTGAIASCYSLGKIRFEGTTPPTISNSNFFVGAPTDCIISVPVGSLGAYTTATNYPDPATYTYVEE